MGPVCVLPVSFDGGVLHSPQYVGTVFETPVSFDGGYILHTPLPSVWVRCSKPLYLLTVGTYSPSLCMGPVFETPVSFDGGYKNPSQI